MTVHVGREAADRIGAAAELGDDVEHRKVGQVVADEDRMPAGEWWELHQRPDCVALVDRGWFDIDDEFSGKYLGGVLREASTNRANRAQHARFARGRLPVVQGKRIALVLDQDARCQRCDFRERAFEVIAQWYGPRLHRRVATPAHLDRKSV